ncbi:MAG: ABC transporter permease, partial [Lachnoanaerobaculum sp.]|nr:ABC transporter permease [Lachnoanaerobaculum sp.]
MTLSTLLGSIELGLIFAILSLGLFIAFRILDLPDLTVDGSFVTGLAYSAIWSVAKNPAMGLLMGALGGMIAGIVTGILHTKLKIHAILAGILTMTGLYSINLFVMGDKPSVFFYGEKTVFTPFEGKFFIGTTDIGKLILLFIIVVVLVAALKLFL